MIDRSALGQAVAGNATHVVHPLRDSRLLHSLVNVGSPIDGTGRSYPPERVDSHYIRSISGTVRYTNNDYGFGKSHEKRQNRSTTPLLRTLNQTAVALVPLSACNRQFPPRRWSLVHLHSRPLHRVGVSARWIRSRHDHRVRATQRPLLPSLSTMHQTRAPHIVSQPHLHPLRQSPHPCQRQPDRRRSSRQHHPALRKKSWATSSRRRGTSP